MPSDQYPEKSSFRSKALPAFVVLLIFAGLYISSLYNYLLFHTLVEISCVVISCVIFVLAWNTRSVQDNQYLLFLGTAFLFTAVPELPQWRRSFFAVNSVSGFEFKVSSCSRVRTRNAEPVTRNFARALLNDRS